VLTVTDFFCGAGGSSQGMHNVPGLQVATAANHWDLAVRTHQENFPDVRHDCADISQIDFRRYPRTDLLWASPECTNHSVAKGVKRANDLQPDLFGDVLPEEAAVRSRATMWDVPRYLEAMVLRGRPVLGGVVENVVDARNWALFDAWCMALRALGYDLRLVYLNSMFARARVTPHAPQSRDRMYVVYWRQGNRAPQLEKWLRPDAHCAAHGRVQAVQSWKNPNREWGRYRAQYVYRCPVAGCWAVVEPWALPAAAAIDWTQPGQRIGDRAKPLADKTLARIRAGLAKYSRPLAVPVEGRDGKSAAPADDPLRTMTTRNETGVAWFEPFLAELRGGGSDHRSASDPLATVCASGNHHGLVHPEAMVVPAGGTWNEEARPVTEPFRARTTRETEALLVPYYGTGTARPAAEPVGTLTAHDRYALVSSELAVDDCLFRMLSPGEISRAMAFADDYTVLGNKREQVRQLGNAVTPPAAEILMSALVEAITSEDVPTAA
jgi:DNA (cytosine-5)-methyltransferase 1